MAKTSDPVVAAAAAVVVEPDLSEERAAGQPAQKVYPIPIGHIVFLRIHGASEIRRPFLVLSVDSSRRVSGHAFFAAFDGTLDGPRERLRVRLSSSGLVQYLTDIPEGPGVWEWSYQA